ncbi:egg cell-secreted protein 1.1-like [Coffea arabica]|uniref:Egg cell-secreted protein 1.1-like n=1 Tax=Coffea arabica TaxID=13443 RepID=A0ABM4V334_COFAR
MSYSSKVLLLALLACSISMTPSMFMARPINSKSSTLMGRLKLEDEEATCWESLFELRSCTGEVILFFLNGETYLGPSCCRAIRTIEHHCWPSMLGSLGYTAEEGDILRGYCDAADEHDDSGGYGYPQPPSPPHLVNSTTNSSSHVLTP